MGVFSFLSAARYLACIVSLASRYFLLPGWLFVRPPRPSSTSLSFGSTYRLASPWDLLLIRVGCGVGGDPGTGEDIIACRFLAGKFPSVLDRSAFCNRSWEAAANANRAASAGLAAAGTVGLFFVSVLVMLASNPFMTRAFQSLLFFGFLACCSSLFPVGCWDGDGPAVDWNTSFTFTSVKGPRSAPHSRLVNIPIPAADFC
mmetsp:Transcript_17529/g.38239  ORF Transcript_17529/g.38239 Transcript_17529/m.38239 type:complete len:202 (-) Transcript_17529:1447-2052(-)